VAKLAPGFKVLPPPLTLPVIISALKDALPVPKRKKRVPSLKNRSRRQYTKIEQLYMVFLRFGDLTNLTQIVRLYS
jgi:hypothetical protein